MKTHREDQAAFRRHQWMINERDYKPMEPAMTDATLEPQPTPENAPQEPQSRPKQYLLLTDQITMLLLGKICPGIQCLEVEGMRMDGKDNYMVLVNPIKPPEAQETP